MCVEAFGPNIDPRQSFNVGERATENYHCGRFANFLVMWNEFSATQNNCS